MQDKMFSDTVLPPFSKRKQIRRCFDLEGEKFGKWTVIERCDPPSSVHSNLHKIYWLCKCECGYVSSVSGCKLRAGKSKSCGCGALGTNFYSGWVKKWGRDEVSR